MTIQFLPSSQVNLTCRLDSTDQSTDEAP
jgi:hypothetical protein